LVSEHYVTTVSLWRSYTKSGNSNFHASDKPVYRHAVISSYKIHLLLSVLGNIFIFCLKLKSLNLAT